MVGGLDSNVKLLVHADGSEGSYAVIDSGFRSAMGGTQTGGHVGSLVGTAAISAVQSKFGGASLSLDGNSDYVTIPDSVDWDFGAGNFTIDFWVRFTSFGVCYICSQAVDGSNYFTLQIINNGAGLETDLQFIWRRYIVTIPVKC